MAGPLAWLRALDRRVERRFDLHPEPGPFPCAWCREEQRHDRCTGKAVRPHLESPLVFWRRTAAAVEDCSCGLHGHRPPLPPVAGA